MKIVIQKTIVALKHNGFTVKYVRNPEEALEILDKMLIEISPHKIAFADSMTADAMGVFNIIRGRYSSANLVDTLEKEITWSEQIRRWKLALQADLFITGTNAVTTSGQLVNLDMIGNRIGGISFGPKKVVLFIGRNKLVDTLDGAMKRVKRIAPRNAARHPELNLPCVYTGTCVECSSPRRICNTWSIVEKSLPKGRITIILIDEDLGL